MVIRILVLKLFGVTQIRPGTSLGPQKHVLIKRTLSIRPHLDLGLLQNSARDFIISWVGETRFKYFRNVLGS